MFLAFRREADLWFLIGAPIVWALHFLASYVLGAVYCAKAESIFTELGAVRIWVFALTAVALLLVVAGGVQAWRHWGFGENNPPHDAATSADRRRFVGYAALLICALSFVAIVFTALPVLFIVDCR